MKKSVQHLINKVAAIHTWLATLKACAESATIKAKLASPQALQDHLQKHTDHAVKEFEKKWEGTRSGQRHHLKLAWVRFVAENEQHMPKAADAVREKIERSKQVIPFPVAAPQEIPAPGKVDITRVQRVSGKCLKDRDSEGCDLDCRACEYFQLLSEEAMSREEQDNVLRQNELAREAVTE